MIFIEKVLTPDEKQKVSEFLDKMKSLLITNDYTFKVSDKNTETDRLYALRDKDKVKILKALKTEDCIDITLNKNPRFDDSEMYIFLKKVNVSILGETEKIELYIKLYIKWYPSFDKIIVVSFHKSQMYE